MRADIQRRAFNQIYPHMTYCVIMVIVNLIEIYEFSVGPYVMIFYTYVLCAFLLLCYGIDALYTSAYSVKSKLIIFIVLIKMKFV